MTNKLKEAMKNVEAIEQADRGIEPAEDNEDNNPYLRQPSEEEQRDYEVELTGAVGDAVAETPVMYTEFTDWRRERLQEDQERLRAEIADIDAQIRVLDQRRDNAMLAFSGISADLTAMDQ